ncbi:MAG: heme-binding domain-containing protein [candidate division Zixibacteria bacterium]|nr:heme-binding domain-containing protein [candidate division Zixibacteria bacterium]
MKNRKPLRLILIVVVVAIVVAQFVPVTRDNPPVKSDFDGPVAVKQVLKKSCYDCHSNETIWPWYSYVAPVSWLVASDVSEARQKLNFSDWGVMSSEKQARIAEAVWDEVEKGDMPLSQYLLLHSDAKPTDADKVVLRGWAGGGTTQPSEPLTEYK